MPQKKHLRNATSLHANVNSHDQDFVFRATLTTYDGEGMPGEPLQIRGHDTIPDGVEGDDLMLLLLGRLVDVACRQLNKQGNRRYLVVDATLI